MGYYYHSTPGRLRIKTPIIKHNPSEIERVRGMLQTLSGVDAVSINALTGSITINYWLRNRFGINFEYSP